MSCGGYNFFTHPSVHQSVIHSVWHVFFLSGECNSSETAQQNFIKLCSYEGHNACVDVIFSPFFTWELYPFELKIWKNLKNLTNWNRLSAQLLWNEQLELWPKYAISCNLCETGLAWMTEKLFNQITFWQRTFQCYTNVTIIYRLCVSDYYRYSITIFCPIAHH